MQIGFSFPSILRSPFVSRVIGINDELAEKLLRPQPCWNVISPIRLSPQKLTWPSKEKTLPLKPIYYAGMTQRKCNDISSKDTASSFSHCLDGPSKWGWLPGKTKWVSFFHGLITRITFGGTWIAYFVVLWKCRLLLPIPYRSVFRYFLASLKLFGSHRPSRGPKKSLISVGAFFLEFLRVEKSEMVRHKTLCLEIEILLWALFPGKKIRMELPRFFGAHRHKVWTAYHPSQHLSANLSIDRNGPLDSSC